MNTPIADFVKKYIEGKTARFHMPGHKGKPFIGIEQYDITEIGGADDLGSAEGIIKESENNASVLFESGHTYYTTQGSTTAICAMLNLVNGENPLILAVRNVHKAFLHACAFLDYEVAWILPEESFSILDCKISPQLVEKGILGTNRKPSAVYLTSPDYLGNIQDISGIASVCKKYDVPLLVDNAHGAYLGFLENPLHPISLGACACCDSAHKTLPVLTGGAYLHIAKDAPEKFFEKARTSLNLFSSTSPSYLTLQSLDLCNAYLAGDYKSELWACIKKVRNLKAFIKKCGFSVLGTEELKITVETGLCGYRGDEVANVMREYFAEPEYCDADYVVLMLTPQNDDEDFEKIKKVFSSLSPREKKKRKNIRITLPEMKLSIREAVFSQTEIVDVNECEGRICALPAVSCPPAIPIAISGEVINSEIKAVFKFYGIEKILVVKS